MQTKNLQISFPKQIWQIINQDLNWFGNTESERIQNIVISFIIIKNQNTNSKQEIQQIKENIKVIEDVISTVIDLHVMDGTKECMKNEISK